MSGCEPFFGPDRNVSGVVCRGRGGRKGEKLCAFCRSPSAQYECDGPKPGGKTCDADLCGRCAVSIRALDVDYCPRCLDTTELVGCLCGPTAEHHCRGPMVAKDQLCLAHCLLFTHWLRDLGGFKAVYADPSKTQEQKRAAFGSWLKMFRTEDARRLFERFGWRRAA